MFRFGFTFGGDAARAWWARDRTRSAPYVEATGLLGSIVHPLIHKLLDAHFLEFVGRVPRERTVLYRIRDNYWWEAARRYAADRRATTERAAS